MKNEKVNQYFEEIACWETEPLFLTQSTDKIKEEIAENCIYIGISEELCQQISTQDFLAYLQRIKNNRQQQLQSSDLSVCLWYYLWFDEQAGQLRFNFINSNHEKLPFGCDLNVVSDEASIIQQFLSTKQDYTQETYTLDVYQETICP